MKKNWAFTLIEILIVIAIIAILATVLLYANINSAAQKARDSKRKQDLNKITRSLEDYYNDHGQYPPGNDTPNGQIKNAPWGLAFDKYIPQLPTDPSSPTYDYYYQPGPNSSFYVLYTRLENTSDSDIQRVGCQSGCGPMDNTGYRAFNFFVSSGDVLMANGIPNGQEPPPIHGAPTGTPVPPTQSGGISPSPTLNLTPPAGPNDICNNNQCCLNHWCGAGSSQQGGHYCAQTEKCLLNQSFVWVCACANTTCAAPNPACP